MRPKPRDDWIVPAPSALPPRRVRGHVVTQLAFVLPQLVKASLQAFHEPTVAKGANPQRRRLDVRLTAVVTDFFDE